MERGTRAFVATLEEWAKASLSTEGARHLTHNDRKELERGLRTLRPAFDGLTTHIVDLNLKSPESESFAVYSNLWRLMTAVYQIGAYGVTTESAKGFFAPQIRMSQAHMARTGNSKLAAARKAEIGAQIKRIMLERNIQASALKAGRKHVDREYRSEVLKRLGRAPDEWGYSVATFVAVIGAIRKETNS